MEPSNSQTFESYLPPYHMVPDKWEEAREFLAEQLKKHALAINAREIGFYLDQELLSGKAFFPGENIDLEGGTSEQFRSVLRKVVDFGSLPNSTTKSIPHEIFVNENFSLIHLYLSATDPTAKKAFSLSYWSNSSPGSIILDMDDTNFNVTTTSNYGSYTRCYVICEYIQEL